MKTWDRIKLLAQQQGMTSALPPVLQQRMLIELLCEENDRLRAALSDLVFDLHPNPELFAREHRLLPKDIE